MIEVHVSDYCHDCPGFYPDINTLYGDDGTIIHHITCSNRDECRHIKLHLEKKLKEKKDE